MSKCGDLLSVAFGMRETFIRVCCLPAATVSMAPAEAFVPIAVGKGHDVKPLVTQSMCWDR